MTHIKKNFTFEQTSLGWPATHGNIQTIPPVYFHFDLLYSHYSKHLDMLLNTLFLYQMSLFFSPCNVDMECTDTDTARSNSILFLLSYLWFGFSFLVQQKVWPRGCEATVLTNTTATLFKMAVQTVDLNSPRALFF